MWQCINLSKLAFKWVSHCSASISYTHFSRGHMRILTTLLHIYTRYHLYIWVNVLTESSSVLVRVCEVNSDHPCSDVTAQIIKAHPADDWGYEQNHLPPRASCQQLNQSRNCDLLLIGLWRAFRWGSLHLHLPVRPHPVRSVSVQVHRSSMPTFDTPRPPQRSKTPKKH